LLAYLGSVALVAVQLGVAFSGAFGRILDLLWLVTLIIPGLLLRRLLSHLTRQNAVTLVVMIAHRVRWSATHMLVYLISPWKRTSETLPYQGARLKIRR
jgi:hypothetical protein